MARPFDNVWEEMKTKTPTSHIWKRNSDLKWERGQTATYEEKWEMFFANMLPWTTKSLRQLTRRVRPFPWVFSRQLWSLRSWPWLINQPLVGWMGAQVSDSVLIVPTLPVLWLDHLLFAFASTLRVGQWEHGSSLGLISTSKFRSSWVWEDSALPLPTCLQEVIFGCATSTACCS